MIASFSGTVIVAGGNNSSTGQSFSSAELFNPIAGTFSATADMTAKRQSARETLLNSGKVLVTGGETSTGTLSVPELNHQQEQLGLPCQ